MQRKSNSHRKKKALSPKLKDAATWPSPVRQAVDAIAAVIVLSCSLAYERMTSASAPNLRWAGSESFKDHLIARQLRLITLLQSRLRRIPEKHRPQYRPEERIEILKFQLLEGWSTKRIAKEFILSTSTVRMWLRKWKGDENPGLFFGRASWNKYSDAIHELICEFRSLIPEAHVGTRTIANLIRKAGVELSRSTVQRALKKPPKRTAYTVRRTVDDSCRNPHPDLLLRPVTNNRVWHIDLTQIRFLCFQVHVAALLDGYSRKLLTLKAYSKSPTAREMASLVLTTTKNFGKPRFVISDHGPQFRKQFEASLRSRNIEPVRGQVASMRFNGKVERFFRSLKLWQRMALFLCTATGMQRHLERFRGYYNSERVHQGIDGMTPNEMWNGTQRPPRRKYLARDPERVEFRIVRKNYDGDLFLPSAPIDVIPRKKLVA